MGCQARINAKHRSLQSCMRAQHYDDAQRHVVHVHYTLVQPKAGEKQEMRSILALR